MQTMPEIHPEWFFGNMLLPIAANPDGYCLRCSMLMLIKMDCRSHRSDIAQLKLCTT